MRFALATTLLFLVPLCGVSSASGVIGAPVPDFTLPDYLGQEHSLADFEDKQLVVVAFLGVECPLAKLYAGRLQSLADEYGPQGVGFLAVDSNAQDSLTEIASYARRHGVRFPVLKDRGNEVAELIGAERTPQVFLLDRSRKVRYAGRVDDQYVVGIVRDAPTREDLREAIDELLAGRSVSTPVTKALGCLIGRVKEPVADSAVTYTRDIAPIIQARCVECHRAGEIGPFAMDDYGEVAGWGDMIAEVVEERRMPPWHASPDHGTFANDRSMTDAEIATIRTWVDNGCPEGDPADLPQPREFTAGWQLPREPDQVFLMRDQPYRVAADAGPSGIPYQRFRVPTGFTKDRWVRAAEVQPGNRTVVHHIIVYVRPPGTKKQWDKIFLAAYVPGLRLDPLPEGAAKLVPAGSELEFEMHYTPVGTPQEDVSRVGLIFAEDAEVTHEVITAEIGNLGFRIPPGEPNHLVTGSSRAIKAPVTLLSLSPHMHLRGKSFRYDLIEADGTRRTLLDVPRYDFNWQTRYVLTEPITLPKDAVLHGRAHFDNSPANLANPDPTKEIRWGDQSWEEMMLGYFDVMTPRTADRPPGKKPVTPGIDVIGSFDSADADGDLALTIDEVQEKQMIRNHFPSIDADGNQRITLSELMTAARKLGAGR